jgi:formylglycine-generating enzyme required for sulfatase activity
MKLGRCPTTAGDYPGRRAVAIRWDSYSADLPHQQFEISNAGIAASSRNQAPAEPFRRPRRSRAMPILSSAFPGTMRWTIAAYGLSLPTETQWDWMARGLGSGTCLGCEPPGGSHQPGGAACQPDDADGAGAGRRFPKGDTPDGVSDVTGSVWEWVDGWWMAWPIAQAWSASSASCAAELELDAHLKASYRLGYHGDFRYAANGGFRCAAP